MPEANAPNTTRGTPLSLSSRATLAAAGRVSAGGIGSTSGKRLEVALVTPYHFGTTSAMADGRRTWTPANQRSNVEPPEGVSGPKGFP